MDLLEFVPGSVLRETEPTPWVRWPRGAVLFADVSGFTPMSEALSTLGAEGAEILTDVLNRYFAAMIGLVHGAGGEVMKFGGDAILCAFPGDDGLPRALATALRMQERMPSFAAIRTPVRRFALKMKVGVAVGESLLAGLGDPAVRLDWAFAGPPVDATSDAEHHAGAGDVVVALDPADLPPGAAAESLAPGFCRLLGVPGSPAGAPSPPPAGDPRPWLIAEVAELVGSGHARQVASLAEMVPVFVAFSGFSYTVGTLEPERLDRFVRLLNETLARFGGRLNRISMGDKGSTALALFGAPQPLEGKERMAAQWILELRRLCAARFPELALRFGAASGRGFSGIVGAAGRHEYTVMGDVVNFAARLMQGAIDGQACVNRAFADRAGGDFVFALLGERRFKGKSEPLPVFELGERLRGGRLLPPDGEIVGREAERAEIRRRIAERPGEARIVVVSGEAGAGKSFLLRHLAAQERVAGRRVVAVVGDPALRHTRWAPWRDPAIELIFDGAAPDSATLDARLVEANPAFLADRSLHAAFWEMAGADPAPLSAEGAAAAFAHQFGRLLAQRLGTEPTLLVADGLEWFDSASLDLLGQVAREAAGGELSVAGGARPGWEEAALGAGVEILDRPLAPMGPDGVALLAAARLGREPAGPLVGFLESRAGGNPLLTLTLLALLEREGLLDTSFGRATLARGAAMRFTGHGDEILAAALAGLPGTDRLHLQAAAAIGAAIDEPLLRRVVGRPFRAASLASLARGGQLRRDAGGRWSFAHGMVRETIYRSLPARERRRWHARVGAALESDAEPGSALEALATHWGRSGSRAKAIHWNLLAGDRLLRQSSFPEAAHFLGEAWRRLARSRDERRWRAGLDYGRALLQAGRFDESLEVSRRLERGATRAAGLPAVALEAAANRFDALQRKGDFSFADEAEARAGSGDDASHDRIRLLLGLARLRGGTLDAAEVEFARVAAKGPDAEPSVLFSAISSLAFVQKTRGRFAEALETLERGTALGSDLGHPAARLRLEMVKAGILTDQGSLDVAASLYRELLPQLERVGDPYLAAFGHLNLASCAWQLGELDEAGRFALEAQRLFGSVGSREGLAQSLETRGIVRAVAGDPEGAVAFYREAMEIVAADRLRERVAQLRFNLAESLLALGRRDEVLGEIALGEEEARSTGDEALLGAFAALRRSVPAEG